MKQSSVFSYFKRQSFVGHVHYNSEFILF